MAKFPEPPSAAELARIRPDHLPLPAGTRLYRIFSRSGSHPSYWNAFRAFGPTTSRFDHHCLPQGLQNRRVLYAALSLGTCVAEVFQALRVIDRSTNEPWVVEFRLRKWMWLLDLSGEWPTRAGASMALNSGRRDRAQRWARTIYEAYSQIQGLYYPSSMLGNEPCVALFERAEIAMPAEPEREAALTEPVLLPELAALAQRIGYGLL